MTLWGPYFRSRMKVSRRHILFFLGAMGEGPLVQSFFFYFLFFSDMNGFNEGINAG